jgi:hypothetical protein
MSDSFLAHRKRLDEFREKLQYVEGAAGAVVAIGDRVVACDLFDKPSTCRKVWDRLLTGFVLDALEMEEQEQHARTPHVEQFVRDLNKMPWEPVEPVGEGEESRAECESGDHASALSLNGVLVHGSLVAQP